MLWLLADRWRFDGLLSAEFLAREIGTRITWEVYALDLSFSWFVEDRVAIRSFATAWYRPDGSPQYPYDEDYSWQFGIALDYRLDAALF